MLPQSRNPVGEEPRTRSRGGLRLAGVLSLVLVLALALGACGGDDDEDGAAAGGNTAAEGEPKEMLPLKITIGARVPHYSSMWLAFSEGLFEKHGVDVEVVTYDGTATQAQLLATGGTDLSMTGTTVLAGIRKQGVDIKVLYLFNSWTYRIGGLVGSKDLKTLDDLRAKGEDCRIATQPPGGGHYGTAKALNRAFGIKCELVSFPTDDGIIGGMTSGSTDAASGVSPTIYTVRDKGQGNLLLDPATVSDEDGKKLVPNPVPYWVIAGEAERIEEKREAVERFIAAMRDAAALSEPMTADEMTQSMVKWTDAFAGIPVEGIAQTMNLLKPGMPTGERAGEITEESWTAVEDAFSFWELPGFSKDDPELQYDGMVDMSYFEATEPVPACEGGAEPTPEEPCRIS